METQQIIYNVILFVVCIGIMYIVFGRKSDAGYLQTIENGKIVDSSTRLMLLIGNIVAIGYIWHQVNVDKEIDFITLSVILGMANGQKVYQEYNDKKNKKSESSETSTTTTETSNQTETK